MGKYMDWSEFWRDASETLVLLLFISAIVLVPFIPVYLFWLLLNPVGFWQILVFILFAGGLLTFLYILELGLIALVA